MRFLWERMKLVVEPTGALGLAAAYRGKVPVAGKRVGAVLSGGNVDLLAALELFRGLPAE
jgi:threonine dehydratase